MATPIHDTPTDPNTTSDDKMHKAFRFWQHPSLQGIPFEEKRSYLKAQGITEENLHQLWERLADTEPAQQPGSSTVAAVTPMRQPQSPTSYPTNALTAYPPSSLYAPPEAYPQQQQQQQQQQQESITMLQGSTLVAVGGFLGLTAAAALRWLNGGDFELLPSPSMAASRTLVLREEPGENVEDEPDEIIEEDDDELIERLDSISQTLQEQGQVQRELLRKVNASQTTSITNSSMDLLRPKATTVDNKPLMQVWKELVEIKLELQSLRQSDGERSSLCQQNEGKLNANLAKLETCLTNMEGVMNWRDETVSSTEPISQIQSNTSDAGDDHAVLEESPKLEEAECLTTPLQKMTIREAIRTIAEENDATTIRIGTHLLYLYIVNLSGKPDNSRYRKIFKGNDSFQKVEAMKGGKELLLAVGFEESDNCMEWFPNESYNEEKEAEALESLKQVASALGILKSGKPSSEITNRALSMLLADDSAHDEQTPPSSDPTIEELPTQND